MAVKWKQFNLIDLVIISNKKVGVFEGEKEYIATGDIDAGRIVSNQIVTYENKPSRADLLLTENNVLFAKMKGTIKVLVGKKEYEDKIFSTGFYIITPKDNVSLNFLYFFLISKEFNLQKDSYCTGATMSAITNEGLKKIKIKLPVNKDDTPDLSYQDYLASLLKEAEDLKNKRLEVDNKMTDIVPALFIKMFGHPDKNSKGFSSVKVGDLLDRRDVKCGPFGSALKRAEYVPSGIPVWGIPNVLPNKFIEGKSLFITEDKYKDLLSYSVIKGDLLISRAGTVGQVCVANPSNAKSIIGTNLIRVSLDREKIIPEFLSILITYFASSLINLRMNPDEGAYSFMSTKTIKSMVIFLPPFNLQSNFINLIKELDSQKEKQHESTQKVDELFNAVMAKSFA